MKWPLTSPSQRVRNMCTSFGVGGFPPSHCTPRFVYKSGMGTARGHPRQVQLSRGAVRRAGRSGVPPEGGLRLLRSCPSCSLSCLLAAGVKQEGWNEQLGRRLRARPVSSLAGAKPLLNHPPGATETYFTELAKEESLLSPPAGAKPLLNLPPGATETHQIIMSPNWQKYMNMP